MTPDEFRALRGPGPPLREWPMTDWRGQPWPIRAAWCPLWPWPTWPRWPSGPLDRAVEDA